MDEYCAEDRATTLILTSITGPTPYNDITENVVVQGANITMTSDFLSYSNLCYALRYQGTSMVSAWKYEYKNYNTNNCHMKITCRSVAASTSIDDIANEAFWSTGNGNDVVRYFLPAVALVTSTDTR